MDAAAIKELMIGICFLGIIVVAGLVVWCGYKENMKKLDTVGDNTPQPPETMRSG